MWRLSQGFWLVSNGPWQGYSESVSAGYDSSSIVLKFFSKYKHQGSTELAEAIGPVWNVLSTCPPPFDYWYYHLCILETAWSSCIDIIGNCLYHEKHEGLWLWECANSTPRASSSTMHLAISVQRDRTWYYLVYSIGWLEILRVILAGHGFGQRIWALELFLIGWNVRSLHVRRVISSTHHHTYYVHH